jgi:hypothetical protein
MKQLRRVLEKALIIAAAMLLAACKHPLEVQGRGDIIETAAGVRGCSLEEFQAGVGRCRNNTVNGDEDAVYRALPRPGWRFSHWEGGCAQDSAGQDCNISYLQSLADFWDENFPDQDWPALKAIFVQDGNTLAGAEYTASQFGGISGTSYAALLDALFDNQGNWRFTTQQATQPQLLISRREYRYDRRSGGLVGSGVGSTREAGAATRAFDLVALADTEGDDTSVTFYIPKRETTAAGLFQGSWYCGHISTRVGPRRQGGYARFFRAELNDSGSGVFTIVADRWGEFGSQVIGYTLFEDGTALLNYVVNSRVVQLSGSLSADGNLFVGSEIAGDARGIGACVRQSANNTLATVAGTYYGTYVTITSPLYTAVTQRDFTSAGSGDLTIRRDSLGRNNRRLGDFVLAGFSGQLQTGTREGAISPDGQVMFLIDVRENELPSFSLYMRAN